MLFLSTTKKRRLVNFVKWLTSKAGLADSLGQPPVPFDGAAMVHLGNVEKVLTYGSSNLE